MDKQKDMKALDDALLDDVNGGVAVRPAIIPNPSIRGIMYDNIPQQIQEESIIPEKNSTI